VTRAVSIVEPAEPTFTKPDMSAPDIIAKVTEAMRRRLASALAAAFAETTFDATGGGPLVTVLPPDRALVDNPNGLNLFLYLVVPDEARPSPRPGVDAPEPSPLALRLRYLVTALGPHDDGTHARDHHLLGLALRALHDRPILDAAELDGEAARIVPLPITAAELAALWTSCGARQRISYEVGVVRIGA
jgi:hypothetical protein